MLNYIMLYYGEDEEEDKAHVKMCVGISEKIDLDNKISIVFTLHYTLYYITYTLRIVREVLWHKDNVRSIKQL